MRIFIRLLMLGTCAAVGVALAVSVIESIPAEQQEIASVSLTSNSQESAAGSLDVREVATSSTGESLAANQATAVESVALAPELALTAPTRANDAPDQQSLSMHSPTNSGSSYELGSQAMSAPFEQGASLPQESQQRAAYRPALTQEIEALERSIRNLQDSSDLQRSQLRDTVEWLREQPLPAALREQLDAAPLPPSNTRAEAPQIAPPAATMAPEQPPIPTAEPLPAIKQEILANEGDDSLRLTLQNADIREVLDLLGKQAGLNIMPSRNVQGQVTATISNVDVEAALDAILRSNGYSWQREGPFIYAGTREDLQAISRDQDRISTRVYRPNYVNASEIQNLITNLLTAGVGAVTVSTAAEIDIPADNVHTGGNSFGGQDVVLVRDYETVLLQIDQVLQEVDVQPLQVAIQAMILSVKLDDSNDLGVNFELLRQNENVRIVSGGGIETIADLTFDGGLKVGFLDSNLAGFISALERVGQTNVIAKPHLMCLNKQRAEILIGEQLGYVSTTVTENAATQSVEFLEVGTQLRLRPFISSDGMIRMEVHPELSTGNVRVEQNFTLPDKDVTQVTTNIMCRDGATIVIGGLIREDLAVNNSQIPLLGSLPLIGAAFRQQKESTDREELIVLITPRIVCHPEAELAGAEAAADFEQHQLDFADKMSPLGKRHIGRQYLRKARAAWNVNDPPVALRYVNLALHYDPQLIEATRLREEIVGVTGVGNPSIHRHLKEGLVPWEHPVREYSRRGAPWREVPAAAYGPPPGPTQYELGTPGGIRTIEAPPVGESVLGVPQERLPAPR